METRVQVRACRRRAGNFVLVIFSSCRPAVARALGKIGNPEAFSQKIEMLRTKSLNPDKQRPRSGICWHDEEKGFRSYLKSGAGSQAIVMGLIEMGPEYHARIVDELIAVRTEIEESELFNAWSKHEIDRAIRFFKAPPQIQTEVRLQAKLVGLGHWNTLMTNYFNNETNSVAFKAASVSFPINTNDRSFTAVRKISEP